MTTRVLARGVPAVACLLVAIATAAAGAYASGPRLRLVSNGTAVPNGQRSAVIDETAFPGFTCTGFNGAMSFARNPARTLMFTFEGEGGSEGFNTCKTTAGEEVFIFTASEGGAPHLRKVNISAETVTEVFQPAPRFEDRESGCVWELRTLAGSLPSSGSLEDLHLSGALRLLPRLSSRTCPRSGAASGSATIEAAPEGAPPGSYKVEAIG